MSGPLLLTDTPWLLYRSHFGLPRSIKGADGRPVGALLGTVNTVLALVQWCSPRAVVCCMGAEEAEYRAHDSAKAASLYRGLARSSDGAVRAGAEVYAALRRELSSRELSSGLGDEGGFAPEVSEPEEVLRLLVAAIRDAGYIPGPDGVSIAFSPNYTDLWR